MDELINDISSPAGLSLHDIATARTRREKDSPLLDEHHRIVAQSEAGLLLGAFGVGGDDILTVRNFYKLFLSFIVAYPRLCQRHVPISVLKSIMLHERLPDDWTVPSHQLSLADIGLVQTKLESDMAAFREGRHIDADS